MSDIIPLLDLVVEKNASDIHLAVGRPPVIRLHGSLHNVNRPSLTPEDTEALGYGVLIEYPRVWVEGA